VHAQHEDEERVDLHVEPGTHRRHRAGAPRHLPVDGVERQRHGGEGDQRGLRRPPGEQALGNYCGDTADEQRPGERHDVGGPEHGPPGSVHRGGQQPQQAHRVHHCDQHAERSEPERGYEPGQEEQLPAGRCRLSRSHHH
jgi:hypothetical protein